MKSFNKESLLKLFWILSFGFLSGTYNKPVSQNKSDETPVVYSPVETISYKTDTLDTPPRASMYYTKNQIIRNYVDNNNQYKMRLPFFAHENWHHHNHKIKHTPNSGISPDETFKLCAWDEISANICAALTARYEYLYSAKPDSISKEYSKTCFKFYFDAIKSGKIKPSVKTISDAECNLLLDGSIQNWTRKQFNSYRQTHENMVIQHFHRNNFFATKTSRYTELRNNMLNIGGINFAAYLTHDLDLYDEKISIMEQMFGTKSLENVWENILNKIINDYDTLSQLDNNSKKIVLWHLVASEKLKYILESGDTQIADYNKQSLQYIYCDIINDMHQDYNLQAFITNFELLPSIKQTNIPSLQEIIKQTYTYNDVCLSDILDIDIDFIPSDYLLFHQHKYLLSCLSYKKTSNKEYIKKSDKPRRSETQYIDVPNFYIPILKNTTKIQQDEIRKIITKYESIPTVLKECDTNAQIEYLKQHQR